MLSAPAESKINLFQGLTREVLACGALSLGVHSSSDQRPVHSFVFAEFEVSSQEKRPRAIKGALF